MTETPLTRSISNHPSRGAYRNTMIQYNYTSHPYTEWILMP